MMDGGALVKGLTEAQCQKAVELCVDQNRLDIGADNPHLSAAFVLKNLLRDHAKSALGLSASPGDPASMQRFSTAPPQQHVIPHSPRQGRRAPEILTRATECFHPK